MTWLWHIAVEGRKIQVIHCDSHDVKVGSSLSAASMSFSLRLKVLHSWEDATVHSQYHANKYMLLDL